LRSFADKIFCLFRKKSIALESSSPKEEKSVVLPPERDVSFYPGLLKDKKVLITGAGENIGKNIVWTMAEQGAQIYFTDIQAEKCRKLESELLEKNITGRGFDIDGSNIDELNVLLTTLSYESIHIDVLVNNLGMRPARKPFHEIDAIEWRQAVNTNIIGPAYLTKHIVRKMIEKKIHGSIIFITSIHQETVFGSSSYSSSKAAIAMLIKEMAMDCAQFNIRVNGIAPGWVAENEQKETLFHEATPLYKCSIHPRYIGRCVVYLASDYFSRFTTGSIIKIDSGLSLHSYLTTEHG
jgi:NAD(P)-dependent dehydrogenase (short-subunit alcohol dehydrogenase family)